MSNSNAGPERPPDRVIRVFVSSTFRDMQEERDELVLRVFPQLRRLCEERGVTWGEVDLRWGITEEQAGRGEVLPICLEEIRRCRPYFIGLLGERYGWIPGNIPPEVIEHAPWIREYADGNSKTSVTELEIRHGVLNDPAMADHAFFYFRDPAYVDTIPEDLRRDFTAEDTESTEKLRRLKERIRQCYQDKKLNYAPREQYTDPKTLGKWVLSDFTILIDTLYPQAEQPSPFERERMDHEAFARSRASVYIGRQEYFDRLDAHAAGVGPPLVVLGESGGGKSALLANWALRYRRQYPDDFLLLHFIGGSPNSASADGIIRRILLELKERFHLPDEVPSQPEKIRAAFSEWLTQSAGRGRILLVMDGLNQLEDVDSAPDLNWLPRVFPKNCRMILATLPGRSLDAINKRDWSEETRPLNVQPLDQTERRRLIHEYLQQISRNLGPSRTQRLVDANQNSNPLFLRVLLDELRVFGVHEKLNDRIDWYLAARDPRELYRKVIARWEEDYADGSTLVRDTLSLLWAARRGLSEMEILEALGQQNRPLPRAVWSPLFLAMSDALVSRSGLLTFAHDFLRTATRDECVSSEAQQKAAYRRVAGYFQQQRGWNDRKLDELPWQLSNAAEWQQLHDSLTDESCFLGIQRFNEFELLRYWRQLAPQYDPGRSYTSAFERWRQEPTGSTQLGEVAISLATFLRNAACYSAAERFYRRALAIEQRNDQLNNPAIAICLSNLALLLQDVNRTDEAEPLIRRALAIDEQFFGPAHPKVAIRLNNLALLLQETNRMGEAEPLLRRALAIDEPHFGADHPIVAIRLNNLAILLQATNRVREAEPLYYRALAIDERFYGPNDARVATRLNNLASLLQVSNRMGQAEPLMRRSLAIVEQAYGTAHPKFADSLATLAHLLRHTNRLKEAEPLMVRALQVTERSFGSDHPKLAERLSNLAALYFPMNRLAEAEPLMRRSVAIWERALGGSHPSVAIGLNNLATLLQATERFEEAEPLMRRALKIDESSYEADHPRVALDLNNLAQLLQATNRLAEAEPLMRRALAISEQSEGAGHPNVAIGLNNLARLLQDTNRLAEAVPLMRRAVAILTDSLGSRHPNTIGIEQNYKIMRQQLDET